MRQGSDMARLRFAPVLLGLLVAGCATTPPRVSAPPPPTTLAPPAPAAAPVDWRDQPLTPGNWRYLTDEQGSSANYGALTLRCLRATRTITIGRTDATASRLTIQTSYARRDVPAAQGMASLSATDPLLDQIAFSRGRFTVEADGLPILVLPSWAEPARVIEDCRS
jgi:hypothetical protein